MKTLEQKLVGEQNRQNEHVKRIKAVILADREILFASAQSMS